MLRPLILCLKDGLELKTLICRTLVEQGSCYPRDEVRGPWLRETGQKHKFVLSESDLFSGRPRAHLVRYIA